MFGTCYWFLTSRLFLSPDRSAAIFMFSILLSPFPRLLCLKLIILSISKKLRSLFLLRVGLNPLPKISAKASLSLAFGCF